MKKFIILLSLLFCWTVRVSAQNTARSPEADYRLPVKGYVGDVGVSFGAMVPAREIKPMFGLFTTHGYRFNSRWFLGAGVGTLNTQFLTFYGQVSANLRRPSIQRPTYPYLTARVGYTVSTWIGEQFADQRGANVELQFGWSFYSRAGRLRYNVFGGVETFHLTLSPKLGVAFEF